MQLKNPFVGYIIIICNLLSFHCKTPNQYYCNKLITLEQNKESVLYKNKRTTIDYTKT